jgi:hypothetical protein
MLMLVSGTAAMLAFTPPMGAAGNGYALSRFWVKHRIPARKKEGQRA